MSNMLVIEAYKFKVRNYVLNARSYQNWLFVSSILKKTCEHDLTNIPLFVRTSTGQSSRYRKIRNPSWSWFPPQGGGPRSSWGGAAWLSPPWLRTNCTTSFLLTEISPGPLLGDTCAIHQKGKLFWPIEGKYALYCYGIPTSLWIAAQVPGNGTLFISTMNSRNVYQACESHVTYDLWF